MTAIKAVASLGVADIGRSIQFYRTHFGFQIADSYEEGDDTVWCWLQTPGADLMLQQLSEDQQITLDPAIGQSWVLFMRVEDVNVTHRQLEKAGVEVGEMRETSYGTAEFIAKDPDGYDLWVTMTIEED
jgi:uncharacterized glyoxalase superfamily protein PhnB